MVLANKWPPRWRESDEEKGSDAPAADAGNRGGREDARTRGWGGAANTPPKPVRIDFDRIERRIVALNLPARPYSSLTAGRAGFFYLWKAPGVGRRRWVDVVAVST